MVDGMAYADVFDGVTPVVNSTCYYVKMQSEIIGIDEMSPFSEVTTVVPQAGLIGFVDGLYFYSIPFYETIIGVPLADASMTDISGMTTLMQSPYTIFYDTAFNTFVPGLSSNGGTEIKGATAYIVGASDRSGEDIIITGDAWSNGTVSL